MHPFEYRRQCISTPVPVPPPRACVAPPTQQPGWPPVQQPIWPPVQQPIHPPIPPVQTPDSSRAYLKLISSNSINFKSITSDPPWLPPQFPPQQPINPPWPPSQPPNQIPDSSKSTEILKSIKNVIEFNIPHIQIPLGCLPNSHLNHGPQLNPQARIQKQVSFLNLNIYKIFDDHLHCLSIDPPWFPPQFPPGQNPVTNPPLVTEPATPCTCAPCVWWPCPPCDCEA